MPPKMDQIEQSLGAKIRKLRINLGFNQQELVAGRYSEAYLSRVERGQMTPSEDFLIYLADRLQVTINSLVEGTELATYYFTRSSVEVWDLELKTAQLELQTGNV